MKTRFTLACTALILAGCSRRPEEIPEITPAPEPERIYRHPTHGFVLRVPDGWDIDDSGKTGAVVLLSPKKSPEDYREQFIVQLEDNTRGLTAQQFFEDSLSQRELVKDLHLVTTAEEMIGNDAAVAWVATMGFGEMQVKTLSYTLIHGKKAYTLTGVAILEAFDEFKGVFRGLALSFQPG